MEFSSICNRSEMDLNTLDLASSPELANDFGVIESDSFWFGSDPSLYCAALNSNSKDNLSHFDDSSKTKRASINEEGGGLSASIDSTWFNQSFDLNNLVSDSFAPSNSEETIFEEIVRESEAFVPQADLCQQAMELSGLMFLPEPETLKPESFVAKNSQQLENGVPAFEATKTLYALPIKTVPIPRNLVFMSSAPKFDLLKNISQQERNQCFQPSGVTQLKQTHDFQPSNVEASVTSNSPISISDSDDGNSVTSPSRAASRKRSATNCADVIEVVQNRKREQNREAARRYRMNKKQEQSKQFLERAKLEKVNQRLRTQAEDIEKEIRYFKDLLHEIRKKKARI